MATIPDLPGTLPGPLFHREGAAQVSYEPGHDLAPLEFFVEGWPYRVSCTEQQWMELIAAVSAVLAEAAIMAGPLAESRRVAARVARMGGGGGHDA